MRFLADGAHRAEPARRPDKAGGNRLSTPTRTADHHPLRRSSSVIMIPAVVNR